MSSDKRDTACRHRDDMSRVSHFKCKVSTDGRAESGRCLDICNASAILSPTPCPVSSSKHADRLKCTGTSACPSTWRCAAGAGLRLVFPVGASRREQLQCCVFCYAYITSANQSCAITLHPLTSPPPTLRSSVERIIVSIGLRHISQCVHTNRGMCS